MDSLKPQDVMVVLKLCAIAEKTGEHSRPSMSILGAELGLSASEIHAALARCRASGFLQPLVNSAPGKTTGVDALLMGRRTQGSERLNLTAISEFLLHGLKYVFPARRGEPTRGVPTSYAAPPLNELITQGEELPPVWPYLAGTKKGATLEPLYRTVPFAAMRDPVLYELLALVDALREGRARERKMAEEQLKSRLKKIHAS